MKILPRDEIGCPTAGVSQPLRFREVKLASPQGPLGAFSFGDIHRDAEVLTKFSRWIAMSYGTMESDAAVGKTNPEFVVIIRSCADCILKSCSYSRFIFRVNGGVKALVWNRTLTGIEAIQAKRFIRYVKNLPCGEIRCPAADVGQALRLRKVKLASTQGLLRALAIGDVLSRTEHLIRAP